MARYINIEDITLKGVAVFDENLDALVPLSDVRKALLMTPTADVVPSKRLENAMKLLEKTEDELYEARGEIEKLTVELEAMRGAANSLKMHYENLAREIFEDIDKCLIPKNPPFSVINYFMFLNLREKYTEGAAADGDKQE